MNLLVVPPGAFGETGARLMAEAVAARSQAIIGLATGNTPIPVYEAVAALGPDVLRPLQHARTFAIDEYGGPRDHPCANRAFFRRYWESIPGMRDVRQFDPWPAEPAAECERMTRTLTEWGGLDLAVLGIGLNGHLAFNEPGTPPGAAAHAATLAESTRQAARACWGEAAPAWGMTLGLAELLAARRVLLLVSGAAKAEIARRALTGPISDECPASHLQRHPDITVLLDEPAAALLPQAMRSGSRQ